MRKFLTVVASLALACSVFASEETYRLPTLFGDTSRLKLTLESDEGGLTGNPLADAAALFLKATRVGPGFAVDLHGNYGACIIEQIDIVGHSTPTFSWAVGPCHLTSFATDEDNRGTHFGIGAGGSWTESPKILRYLLLNASDVRWQFGITEPWENWSNIGTDKGWDWKNTTFSLSLSRNW